ncbi:MAG: winged helix-turn-helix domain-containing protein [Bacteroidota bacterium]
MEKQPPFRIGQFTVDPEHFCMRENGNTIDVSKRLMQLLCFLAARQGEVVTKEMLLSNIWAGVLVSDETIRKSVSDLRILFQQVGGVIEIESIRGVGYRLLSPVSAVVPTKARTFTPFLWALGGVFVLLLSGLGYWTIGKKDAQEQLRSMLNEAPVSTALRWSNDQLQMTYVEQEDNSNQLFLRQEHREVPLTKTNSSFSPEAVFAPHGLQLAYLARLGAERIIRIRDVQQQTERQFVSVAHTPPLSSLDWSPDGQQLLWSEGQTGRPYQLFTACIDSAKKVALTYPPVDYIGDMQARYSPSGKQLCFIRYSTAVPAYDGVLPGLGQLYLKDLESGAELPLLDREMILGGVTWLNEQTIAYIARDFYTFGIHTMDLETRTKQTIYSSPLALRHLQQQEEYFWTEAWQEHYAFFQFRAEDNDPQQAFTTAMKCWHPGYSPNGEMLAFVTKGEQAYELRLRHAAGEEEVLFAAPMMIQSPQWSPQGDALVFMLEGSEAGVCTFELESRKVTPLSKGEYPVWAPDGQSILYVTGSAGQRQIQRHAIAAGSDAETVISLPAARIWPYNTNWIFSHETNAGIWHYNVTTQQTELLISDFDPQDAPNWLIQGDQLFYWTRTNDRLPVLKRYDLESQRTLRLTALPDPLAYQYSGFAIHPQNGAVLFPAQLEVENHLLPVPLGDQQ